MVTLSLSEHYFVHAKKRKPKRHVLLVEDEEEAGLVVKASLKKLENDIDINWVNTAEEAEKLLKNDSRYDLVIADHFLEGEETGFDLWKSCREKYRGVPFLFTSAVGPEIFSVITTDERELPLFLHKPFRIDECKNLLEWVWDDEPTSKTITDHSSIYQMVIAGLLLAVSVIFTSSELTTPKMTSINYDNIEPLKLIIPKTEVSPQQKWRKGMFEEILTRELKSEIRRIQWRADDILEYVETNGDATSSVFSPRGFFFKEIRQLDWNFEKYGRIYRVS